MSSVQEVNLKAIADAIREKEGSSQLIKASTFADRILALPQGIQNPSIILPSGGGQVSEFVRIAQAIKAKEGGDGSGDIRALDFADRILGLEELKISRLPEGYTELKYIDFPGNNTGILTLNSSILPYYWTVNYSGELTMELLANSITTTSTSDLPNKKFFGVNGQSQSGSYIYVYQEYIAYYGSNICINTQFTRSTSSISNYYWVSRLSKEDGKMKISWNRNNNVFSLNNQSTTFNPRNIVTGKSASSTMGVNAFRFYELIIYKSDGSIFKHMVPCRQESNGYHGIFELINGNYIVNRYIVGGSKV